MEEKAVELLGQLAAVLGVSSDFVLQTLYNQVPVALTMYLLLALVSLAWLVFSIRFAIKRWEEWIEEDFMEIAPLICGLAIVISTIALLTAVEYSLTLTINPDMYVLEEIKELISGAK